MYQGACFQNSEVTKSGQGQRPVGSMTKAAERGTETKNSSGSIGSRALLPRSSPKYAWVTFGKEMPAGSAGKKVRN